MDTFEDKGNKEGRGEEGEEMRDDGEGGEDTCKVPEVEACEDEYCSVECKADVSTFAVGESLLVQLSTSFAESSAKSLSKDLLGFAKVDEE